MRRSAAPSSLSQFASKRPRFQTPYVVSSKQNHTAQESRGTVPVSEKGCENADSAIDAPSRLQEILSKIRKTSNGETQNILSSSTTSCSSTISINSPSTESKNTTFPTSSSSIPTSSSTTVPTSSSAVLPTSSTITLLTSSSRFHAPSSRMASNHPPTSSSSNRFCVPGPSVKTPLGSNNIESVSGQDEEKYAAHRYYSVMWCKRSNKKHKTWEGDAIMIVRGNSVALKDMDARDIGKGLGYKKSELCDMVEGSTLIIGGKEIEVMGEVSEEDWKSGKCFTGSGSVDTVEASTVAPPAKKPLTSSRKNLSSFRNRTNQMNLDSGVSPLFSPSMPGALVMPRPNAKHQLEHNVEGLCLVDVVVDPRLSSQLRPHQREGVVFLYQCLMGMRDFAGQGAILADEMGLGKTLQCITLIWTFLKQGPYGSRPVAKKILIITPGSLVKNWEKEFNKWLGRERLRVYCVSGENKAEGFVNSPLYPVLIISYEMFLRSREDLQSVKFDLVVCDEGHRLKNAEAKTTSIISSLPTRKRILLTGTPIQNDLQEFFSIVDFCNPSILGSHTAFQRVYEKPIVLSRQSAATPEEKEIGQARAKELKNLTSLFCLRRTQDIINKYLPPKVESVVFCQMSPLQLSLYKHLLNSRLVKSCLLRSSNPESSEQHRFPPHLICIGALRKLCNSPSLVHAAGLESGSRLPDYECAENTADLMGHESLYSDVLRMFPEDYDTCGAGVEDSGKLAVLSEMLHQLLSGKKEKVVIVSNYTQMLDILQQFCCSRGYGYLRLDGSTPSSKRQSIVERFNNKYSTESVFLLSSKAGGMGLNLIGASHLILYDIDWNPATDLQAMARVWRDGQRSEVKIYRLLTTGTIEEKIFQRQITKQGLNTVLDLEGDVHVAGGDSGMSGDKKWAVNKFTREELKDLFSLREDTLCDTHDLFRCGCAMNGERNTTNDAHNSQISSGVREFLQWHHFSQPLNQTNLSDELLMRGACSAITFVFQTETGST